MKTAALPKQIEGSSPADVGPALQIKTVLVPVDFSDPSMHALTCAISLADVCGAALHLVHVQPPDDLSEPASAGHSALNCRVAVSLMQEQLGHLREENEERLWPENCHIVSGRPFEEICRMARELETDLIVLPTRGHSRLKHLMLGSTAEQVIRHAPCPVLVLRGEKCPGALQTAEAGEKRWQLTRLLMPTDFSREARIGLEYAARLARKTGAALRLFHVVFPYAATVPFDRMSADAIPLIERTKVSARDQIKELAAEDFLRGVECESEVRAGSTAGEICAASGEADIDLVVIATHGRTGFQRALLGSVAEQVVRYAECPVLIVPTRSALPAR